MLKAELKSAPTLGAKLGNVTINLQDHEGSYNRGYAEGYEKGTADGYNIGYDEGKTAIEAVEDAIVTRSITKYRNDRVTSIGVGAFYRAESLAAADLFAVTSVGEYSFYRCSELTALILRSETMASLSNTNALANTPIASGTGFIYVPDNLVEQYKVATRWSTYATQIKPLSELQEE